MSRKPLFSPSKFTNYLACPTKYYWTYLNGRGRYFMRARSYFSFGTSLHRVLQRFHDAGDTGVETVQQAVAALEESWIDAGFDTPQEAQDAMGEGKVILEAYIQRYEESTERATPILIERELRMDMGDFILRGRLDRVDETEDGRLNVLDYKSGRADVTSEEVKNDLAMAAYQVLVAHHYPDRPVSATIVALRTGNFATCSLTPEEREEVVADLTQLGRMILEFEERTRGQDPSTAATGRKSLCERCDFLPLCTNHKLIEASPEPQT